MKIKKRVMSCHIPVELSKRFKAACAKLGVNLGDTLVSLIEVWTEDQEKNDKKS